MKNSSKLGLGRPQGEQRSSRNACQITKVAMVRTYVGIGERTCKFSLNVIGRDKKVFWTCILLYVYMCNTCCRFLVPINFVFKSFENDCRKYFNFKLLSLFSVCKGATRTMFITQSRIAYSDGPLYGNSLDRKKLGASKRRNWREQRRNHVKTLTPFMWSTMTCFSKYFNLKNLWKFVNLLHTLSNVSKSFFFTYTGPTLRASQALSLPNPHSVGACPHTHPTLSLSVASCMARPSRFLPSSPHHRVAVRSRLALYTISGNFRYFMRTSLLPRTPNSAYLRTIVICSLSMLFFSLPYSFPCTLSRPVLHVIVDAAHPLPLLLLSSLLVFMKKLFRPIFRNLHWTCVP